MLWWIIGLGVVASYMTFKQAVPPSRDLVIKLGTLMDMAQRANPERYRSELAPISPFVGQKFLHNRIKGILRADLAAYGALVQRLQVDARRLDVKAHLGMIPVGTYVLLVGLWYVFN